MNRLFSLNDVSTEFEVEQLESRLEMQMLGVGADPSIILPGGTIIVVSFPTGTVLV